MSSIKFVEITPSETHIQLLYTLLNKRTCAISHTSMPDYEEHAAFVKSHPYRKWFLIFFDAEAIGAFYISEQNTIGINIEDKQSTELVKRILDFVKAEYSPLPQIKSVRANAFHINVATTNTFLHEAMKALCQKAIQTTYTLDETDCG